MEQHPEYTLRPARESESPAVATLLRDAVPESVRPLTILGQDGVAEWIAHSIHATSDSSDYPDTVFLVAVAGESICGAAEWRRYDQALFLNSIAVDPAHRQRALGTRLLRWGLTTFDEPSQVALDVFRDNHVARNWYERIGFQTEAARKWLVCPLEAAVDLPDGTLPSTVSTLPSNVCLRNEADADVNHERFGFSTLRFEVQDASESQHHEVGRLGKDYFRITDVSTVQARPICRALIAVSSSRSLLYLTSASPPKSTFPFSPEQTTCRAKSLRMRAPSPVVDTALSDSLSAP
jgi:ribosomal protein S18 acetylase RimI-like enzyme